MSRNHELAATYRRLAELLESKPEADAPDHGNVIPLRSPSSPSSPSQRKRYTDADRQRVLEMRSARKTIGDIHAETGISRSVIGRWTRSKTAKGSLKSLRDPVSLSDSPSDAAVLKTHSLRESGELFKDTTADLPRVDHETASPKTAKGSLSAKGSGALAVPVRGCKQQRILPEWIREWESTHGADVVARLLPEARQVFIDTGVVRASRGARAWLGRYLTNHKPGGRYYRDPQKDRDITFVRNGSDF